MIDGMLGVSSDVLGCHDDIANLDDVDPRRVLYRMLHVNVGATRSDPDWPGPKGIIIIIIINTVFIRRQYVVYVGKSLD